MIELIDVHVNLFSVPLIFPSIILKDLYKHGVWKSVVLKRKSTSLRYLFHSVLITFSEQTSTDNVPLF